MPIVVPTPTAPRGQKDARRHRDKQREEIKKQLPDIIAQESIITKRKGKIVKVSIKSLQNPRFRQGKNSNDDSDGGIGQGAGTIGDVIGRRPGEGESPGPAGQEPGQDYLESEIDIEELIEMMMEDIGLPNFEKKDIEELEVMFGVKIDGLTRAGPWSLLHKNKTVKEGFKRFYTFLNNLQEETKKSELTCYNALKISDGVLEDALALLQNPEFVGTEKEISPFPIFYPDDLRFVRVEEDVERESRAVVFSMMDVSGSMTTEKKYLVRSMLFWIIEFLRKLYDRVEVRFITHHTIARLVEEDDFFRTGESGGTHCYTAFELANSLIDTEYPTSGWNVYPFYFSDGDDFNPKRTMEEVRKTIEMGVQMLAYGEIIIDGQKRNLLSQFKNNFPITEGLSEEGKLTVISGKKDFPFIAVEISEKADVWPAIKEFLKKGRWSK